MTNTFTQVLENPQEILDTMRDIHDTLFEYTTLTNVEEFSSEVSTIQDKEELLKLKSVGGGPRLWQPLSALSAMIELKEKFSKVELTKLPDMLKEVQHHITHYQSERSLHTQMSRPPFLQTEAMQDIEFTFRRLEKRS